MPYFVYILQCADDTFYVGVTNNLERRLSEHQSGLYRGSFTSYRRPVKLKWYTSFMRIEQAIAKEKQLKKWSKAKKQALIDEDWDRVSALAKKVF